MDDDPTQPTVHVIQPVDDGLKPSLANWHHTGIMTGDERKLQLPTSRELLRETVINRQL